MYGFHSTGAYWKFVFIDEDGQLFVSGEFQMNAQNYVKNQCDLVYRLVHYVVKQSYFNSPRSSAIKN